jgi:hypothetical protein
MEEIQAKGFYFGCNKKMVLVEKMFQNKYYSPQE